MPIKKFRINPYNFMKFNFVKDCLLFGIKERFYIVLGLLTWLCIIGIVAIPTFLTIIIYKRLNP